MADILHMVPIAASPAEVYEAITTEAGLRSWWTTDADAKPEVGSVAEFRFEGGQVAMRMRIDELEQDESVTWAVEEPSPPEWEGTKVTWNLAPSEEGTHLLFGHRGWQSTDGSFAAINYNWAYYLMSMVKHLEEGGGFPHSS